MGTKGRPFYRIVVAKSSAGRDGAFIEVIGTRNPTAAKGTRNVIDADKALKWLMDGAQPTETVAHILHEAGVLDKYLAARPSAKSKFKSIDKRTSAMTKKASIEAPKADAVVAVAEPVAAPVVEEVVAEAPVVEAPVEEVVAEAPVAEATPEA
ncbi:MAG: 30S ribosomal protein S16 [Armatimonadetes bacterium]|nr:30S ribosomal protein S16 [Armatimonadota bacterium]